MNVPPHVLIVDHLAALGGAEFSLEALVTSMPQSRYRYLVALPQHGPLVFRLNCRGAQVELVSMESWRWWVKTPERALKFWLTIPLQMISLARWVKYLRARKPDIVHFNINRLIEPVIAARLLKIPSVMHFRDIPSIISYRFALGMGVFYRLMNMTDCWIANSSATKKDIRTFAKRPIVTVPNGVDLTLFDRMVEAQKSDIKSDGRHFVVMVAGLVPSKNHEAYLKLAERIHKRRDDIHFLIAGDGSPSYKAKLRQRVQDLGIGEHVKFLGFVENIPELLSSMALLIHTMVGESFGRVFIEAMAARLPVVAFKSGGAEDIVVEGQTGLLVPPGDLDAMEGAVRRLLDNPALRKQMGKAGRRRVENHFTIDQHCRAVSSVYDQLLSNSRKDK